MILEGQVNKSILKQKKTKVNKPIEQNKPIEPIKTDIKLPKRFDIMKISKGLFLYLVNKLAKAYGKKGNNIERKIDYTKQNILYAVKEAYIKKYGEYIDVHFDFFRYLSKDMIYKVYVIDDFLFHEPVDNIKIVLNNNEYYITRFGKIEKNGKALHWDTDKDEIFNWIKKHEYKGNVDSVVNIDDELEKKIWYRIKKEFGFDIKQLEKVRNRILNIYHEVKKDIYAEFIDEDTLRTMTLKELEYYCERLRKELERAPNTYHIRKQIEKLELKIDYLNGVIEKIKNQNSYSQE